MIPTTIVATYMNEGRLILYIQGRTHKANDPTPPMIDTYLAECIKSCLS